MAHDVLQALCSSERNCSKATDVLDVFSQPTILAGCSLACEKCRTKVHKNGFTEAFAATTVHVEVSGFVPVWCNSFVREVCTCGETHDQFPVLSVALNDSAVYLFANSTVVQHFKNYLCWIVDSPDQFENEISEFNECNPRKICRNASQTRQKSCALEAFCCTTIKNTIKYTQCKTFPLSCKRCSFNCEFTAVCLSSRLLSQLKIPRVCARSS